MKKVLVVEDNKRVHAELGASMRPVEYTGYSVFRINAQLIYLTGELETAKELIQDLVFDAYFLDNEITLKSGGKLLAQDVLISMILKKDPLCPSKHELYNISTHENTSKLGQVVSDRCEKSGYAILKRLVV